MKAFFTKQDPLQELSDDVHHLLLSSDDGIAPPLLARAQIAVLEGAAKDAAKNGWYEKAADLQKEADSMWPDVRTSEDIYDIASKAVKHAKVCTRFVLPTPFKTHSPHPPPLHPSLLCRWPLLQLMPTRNIFLWGLGEASSLTLR